MHLVFHSLAINRGNKREGGCSAVIGRGSQIYGDSYGGETGREIEEKLRGKRMRNVLRKAP